MKIKLDENLPRSAKPVLAAAGHDVDSVEDEGLAGADDPQSSGWSSPWTVVSATLSDTRRDLMLASLSYESTTNPQ